MLTLLATLILGSEIAKASFDVDIEGPRNGVYTITVWQNDRPLVFKVSQDDFESRQNAMIAEIVRKVGASND